MDPFIVETFLGTGQIIVNLLLRIVINGQTHFKNLAANAARFLKCI